MILRMRHFFCSGGLLVFALELSVACGGGDRRIDEGAGGSAGSGGNPCSGVTCDDNNACTTDDRCSEGLCQGTAITCFDDNPCTVDSCAPEAGCVFQPASGPCNDGSICTVGDTCMGGVCAAGTPLDCDDLSSCTSDACDPVLGCIHANLCDSQAICVAAACECNPGYVGDGYVCAPAPPVCSDGECAASENYISCPTDCDHDLVVVVEEALAEILRPSLTMYLHDLDNAGYLGRIEPWTPGRAEELRSLLFEQVDTYGVEGALLVGNLPAAWYEQIAFDSYEEFPLDIFLQDRDAVWSDADDDGIYDAHSELELDIYVSRLQTLPQAEKCGSSAAFPSCPQVYQPGGAFYASKDCIYDCPSRFIWQNWAAHTEPDVECCGTYFLKRYFDRLHDYRTYGSLVDRSALVFVDDSWLTVAQPFSLDTIYATVHVICELEETTLPNYVEMLTGGGAQFLYHWLHATPDNLYIYVDGRGHLIHRTQIGWSPFLPVWATHNLESSFTNMFSCEAARFTIPNIGMAMTLQTDYGLAVIGSTKRGGIWNPDEFHTNLAHGTPWGESFRLWYNNFGKDYDDWHSGIVLLGDPLLILSGDMPAAKEIGQQEDWTPEEIEALRQTIIRMPQTDELDTFEEYRELNPQFFDN